MFKLLLLLAIFAQCSSFVLPGARSYYPSDTFERSIQSVKNSPMYFNEPYTWRRYNAHSRRRRGTKGGGARHQSHSSRSHGVSLASRNSKSQRSGPGHRPEHAAGSKKQNKGDYRKVSQGRNH